MTAVSTFIVGIALAAGLVSPTFAAEQAAATAPPEAQKASAATPAIGRAPMDSMMFTVDELNEIRGRIASGGETDTHGKKQAIEDATLYLSTIVYSNPKEWTIWVNGVPIGPDQEFQSFQVTEINASSVQLLVPLSAQGMRPVRLAPNQTFITKTGAVVEGQFK